MTTLYLNNQQPGLGSYEVTGNQDGFWWTWREIAKGVEYVDDGPVRETEAAAWRDAAADWEYNGDRRNRRFAGQLRAAATRLEKEGERGGHLEDD